MTSKEQNLSAEQKELVAVGASVGAGCQPCVSHHLKSGAKAGLEGEQLLAALASAERISAEAAVAIGDHARARLGTNVTSPALLSLLEEALSSLGAALGANDATNIERQMRAAADLGASRSQLQQAIDTAHNVQENAARIHLAEAERLLEAMAATVAAEIDAHHDDGCGCQSDEEEADEAAAMTEEPVAASGGHTADCGGTATRFAAGDASEAMAGCRETFERFMSAVSPAETDKAPAATPATGACKKGDPK